MIDKINIEKTLVKNKMILKRNIIEHYFDWFMYIAIILILPFLSITYSLTHLDSFKTDLLGQIISNVLTIGFSLYVISGVRQISRIVYLKGTNEDENRKLIKKAVIDYDWILHKEDEKSMIIALRKYRSQINVIFHSEKLIVNSISFGRHGIVSPFFQGRNSNNIDKIKQLLE